MIVEGIVTTLGSGAKLNIAPMGPIVDESMTQLILRPFQTSTTYRNLKEHRFGVFHIVDDVLLIAQSAFDRLIDLPATFPAEKVVGQVLKNCCRWYEFEVASLDDSSERTCITTRVIHTGHVREMSGFNRAKHAVLEATIVATRLHLIPESEVRQQLKALAVPVEKTSGPQERAAFALVTSYVEGWYQENHPSQGSGAGG